MKAISRLALIPSGILIIGLAASASASAQSLTSAPQPASQIQSLTAALSGEWSLNVKFEPSAEIPNGLTNTGEETWHPGPGGFTLIEEEHLRPSYGDLFLMGTVWWNKTTNSLQGIECQNLLPFTCDVKGAQTDITMSWDGKAFVINEMETSKTGEKSVWHEVWSDITPTSFTHIGESGPPGGEHKRIFTIHGAKVTKTAGAHTPANGAASDPSQHSEAPAPQMQSLEKALGGAWSTAYDFAPGGMAPNGGSGAGEEVWRIAAGGFVLTEEEHVRGPAGEVFLFALQWWDKTTNSLRGMLCNNSGPAACDFSTNSNATLDWDGKELTINMQFPQDGKKMLWHEVWSGITATSFTQTGQVGEVGGAAKRAVTIHGAKSADPSGESSKLR